VLAGFLVFADACREGRRIWEAIVLQPELTCPSISAPAPPLLKPIPIDESRSVSNRRRGPPRPLVTSDRRRSQDSVNSLSAPDTASSATSSLSPRSPRAPGSRSPALFGGQSPRLAPTACRGECAAVTAQCVQCRSRLSPTAASAVADLDLDVVAPTDAGGPVFDWPPQPFWPSQALLKAAAAATPTPA